MTHRSLTAALVVAALAVPGCAAARTGSSPAATPARPQAPAGPELPAYAADLSRVCADGLGFPGMPDYRHAAKGVHPAVLMSKHTTWSQDVPTQGEFPRRWILGYQDDVRQAELVICFEQTGSKPAGKVCAMKDDKSGKPLKVTMYNTSWRVRVLRARTGESIYSHNGRASSTRCPFIAFTGADEDPTKYYTQARATDYRALIHPYLFT